MPDLIKYRIFERPFHSQDAPLRTVPDDLYSDKFQAQFYPAIVQQAGGFISPAGLRLVVQQFNQPQDAPLRTIPLDLYRDLFEAQFYSSIAEQIGSFRSAGSRKSDSRHLAFPNIDWISTVISVFDPATVVAAISQLYESFSVSKVNASGLYQPITDNAWINAAISEPEAPAAASKHYFVHLVHLKRGRRR